MSSAGFFDPYFVHRYLEEDALRDADLAFYTNIARKASGRILEVGCGDGRLMIPLIKAHCDVSGFDSSPLMIEALRQKLNSAEVWQADLCEPDSYRGEYSLVICAFNTFLHMLSQEQQLAALTNMYNALAPDGELVIDIINPYSFDIFESGNRQFDATYVTEEGMIDVHREFDSKLLEQRATFRKIYSNENGLETTTEIEFRWIYLGEMRLLLERVGFRNITVSGGFEGQAPTDDSEVLIWQANKKE